MRYSRSVVFCFALLIFFVKFATGGIPAITSTSPSPIEIVPGTPLNVTLTGTDLNLLSGKFNIFFNGHGTSDLTLTLAAATSATNRDLTIAASSTAPTGQYIIAPGFVGGGNFIATAPTLNANVIIPITAFTVNPSAVTGGSQANGTVSLAIPETADGQLTITSSSSQALVGLLGTSIVLTIPKGQSQGAFKIQTAFVGRPVNAIITATLDGKSKQTTLTIQPPPAVASLVVNPTSGGQGSAVTATVTCTVPVISDTAVSLQRIPQGSGDANASVTFPSTVTIPAGKNSASFPISIGLVISAGSVKIGASLGTSSQSAIFNVTTSTLNSR